jgi:hypothetical protein
VVIAFLLEYMLVMSSDASTLAYESPSRQKTTLESYSHHAEMTNKLTYITEMVYTN